MMIVTHEMRLAKKVANRVFYMDEGYIYEDGPAEQVFNNPEREKTRRFIQRLRVLEFNIKSGVFDFAGAITEIEQYCFKNRIAPDTAYMISMVIEELCVQTLMPALKDSDITITVEFSELRDHTVITMEYPDKYRPELEGDDLSSKLLKAKTEKIEYEYDEEKGSRITVIFV